MTIILLMVLLPHLEVMKAALLDGKRYSHIINLDGIPTTGLCGNSARSKCCRAANGLSTSIMVLGQGRITVVKISDYLGI
jgi:thiamine biosynthesis lipoprotein ApbE